MNKSLAETLNELQADRDTLQQGLRLFLSEQTEDKTPTEMLEEMKEAADPEAVEALLNRLREDNAEFNEAVVASLDAAWREPESRPSIEASLRHAKDRLPVLELGILAIVAMYAMYRLIPAQPTRVVTKTTVGNDGSYSEERVEEVEPFVPIVSAMGKLFGKSGEE